MPHRIFAVTFDEPFARATGIRVDFYNMLIAVLTAITIVLGMRMIGALLISSLIIFPAMSAMRLSKRFLGVVFCAAVISVVCFIAGVAVSYEFSAPTGASVVIMNMAVFGLCVLTETAAAWFSRKEN